MTSVGVKFMFKQPHRLYIHQPFAPLLLLSLSFFFVFVPFRLCGKYGAAFLWILIWLILVRLSWSLLRRCLLPTGWTLQVLMSELGVSKSQLRDLLQCYTAIYVCKDASIDISFRKFLKKKVANTKPLFLCVCAGKLNILFSPLDGTKR